MRSISKYAAWHADVYQLSNAHSHRHVRLCFRSPKRKKSFIAGITNALDFSEARSKRDEELLWQARNQKGKLNEEQIG